MKTRAAHPTQRSIQRYGCRLDLGKLLAKVQDGEAKLVGLVHGGRLVYDVPWRPPGMPSYMDTFVRVLVDGTRSTVITVLPQQKPRELALEEMKRREKTKANRKRKFFRQFKDDGD